MCSEPDRLEYSPKATLCELASKLPRHDPLLLKQRRSPLLITCTVLCVSLMSTGAGQPVKRLPLSALDKDGQLDIAECDLLPTKASKLCRHDPLLPEQKEAPVACHLQGLSTHFSAVDPRCLARCLIGTFCIAPRP